jgi:hypothetical protein
MMIASEWRTATSSDYASASLHAVASGVSPGSGDSSTSGASTSNGNPRRDSNACRWRDVDASTSARGFFIVFARIF